MIQGGKRLYGLCQIFDETVESDTLAVDMGDDGCGG